MLTLIQHPMIVAFLLTRLAIWALVPFALSLGLVDIPGQHKTHRKATPLVGGAAMYFGFLAGTLLFSLADHALNGVAFGSGLGKFLIVGLVVVVGAIDDRLALPVALRFRIQIVASVIMVWLLGVAIDSLGYIVPTTALTLGWLALPFTVFAMVGAMNAMNMMDGLDGLAGGVALVTAGLLAAAAAVAGRGVELHELLLLFGAIAAFLISNVRWFGRTQARIFMGDAGSTFLGLTLCYYLIDLSQGSNAAITPVTALCLFALPVCDTLAVILRRRQRGSSPFRAARDHLHHVLLASGLSVNKTSIVIVTIHGLLCTSALLGSYYGVADALLFCGFMTFALTYYWLLVRCADPVAVVRGLSNTIGNILPFRQPILVMNVPQDLDTSALDRELRDHGVKAKIVLLRPAEAKPVDRTPQHVLLEVDARLNRSVLMTILMRCVGGDEIPIALRQFAARSPERDRRSSHHAGSTSQSRERRRRERRVPHFAEAVAGSGRS
jgi:UDP-GlcNAc:undecaprenyl-phosphate/decaprenyl-phosphate GlcNAc-1-phosphate transferase